MSEVNVTSPSDDRSGLDAIVMPHGPCGCCDMGVYSELAMLNKKAREFSVLSKRDRELSMPKCKKFNRECEGAKDFSSAIAQIDSEA
jgi:hypothetical protein